MSQLLIDQCIQCNPKKRHNSRHAAWLASRTIPHQRAYLAPGSQRAMTLENLALAYEISVESGRELMSLLWALQPYRTTLVLFLEVTKGLFPALRCYSQAMVIDEVKRVLVSARHTQLNVQKIQLLVTSGNFAWTTVLRLVAIELLRRVSESLLDAFITDNDLVVQDSIRGFLEYKQLENRLRLDLPTLSDHLTKDLLHESDLFVRSFTGAGGFGLISPRDFTRLAALVSEFIAQLYILFTIGGSAFHFSALALAFFSAALPSLLSWLGLNKWTADIAPDFRLAESDASHRQEEVRNRVLSETYRPEMILFGLGPSMLRQWAGFRTSCSRTSRPRETLPFASFLSFLSLNDITIALQSIPLFMIIQTSHTSLGSLSLYRTSVQSLIYIGTNIKCITQGCFQSSFLLGAFTAAMNIQPQLTPSKEDLVRCTPPEKGINLEVRNLSYTYPGSSTPALKNVSFDLAAGETLAIVGFNGSGKSTLAKMILRILDFDAGSIKVNGVDICKLDPPEYHRKLAVVLQDFSKYHNTSLQENIGIGYVDRINSLPDIQRAVSLAGADKIVETLPNGLGTQMDGSGVDTSVYPHFTSEASVLHGLSGGEWQRIALSRAFMRAERPEVNLLLFDEPTSHLDPYAQVKFFDSIEELSTGTKSVVFITHRLSTAKRADKIAMMEQGTITEFGTHEELLALDGSYCALYHAAY